MKKTDRELLLAALDRIHRMEIKLDALLREAGYTHKEVLNDFNEVSDERYEEEEGS